MFLLVLLCMSLLFDIATHIMQKESGHKVYYEVVRAIEAASGFIVLDGSFVCLVMAPAKAAEENIVLTEEEMLVFPAIVVCAFAIRVCIAFYHKPAEGPCLYRQRDKCSPSTRAEKFSFPDSSRLCRTDV